MSQAPAGSMQDVQKVGHIQRAAGHILEGSSRRSMRELFFRLGAVLAGLQSPLTPPGCGHGDEIPRCVLDGRPGREGGPRSPGPGLPKAPGPETPLPLQDIKAILEAGGISLSEAAEVDHPLNLESFCFRGYEDELIEEACRRMEGKQASVLELETT